MKNIIYGWPNTVDMYYAKHGIIIEKYYTYSPLSDVKANLGYGKDNAGFGWTNGIYMCFFNENS